MKPEYASQVEQRRERVRELRVLGASLTDITKLMFKEDLLPSSNFAAGYALIRKDIAALRKIVTEHSAEVVASERELYIDRLERIYKNAVIQAGDPNLTAGQRSAFYWIMLDAAEKIAAARGVQTKPKVDMNLNLTFDPVEAAAQAVVERQRARERALAEGGKAPPMINITPTKTETS